MSGIRPANHDGAEHADDSAGQPLNRLFERHTVAVGGKTSRGARRADGPRVHLLGVAEHGGHFAADSMQSGGHPPWNAAALRDNTPTQSRHVAQGQTDAQVAAQLYISIRTVCSHLDRIRDKTGCRRRADLTRLALSAGLV